MKHSTWTFRTFDDGGETDRVVTGLSHLQAVQAIQRAISGLDPFEGEREHLSSAAPETTGESQLPTAA